MDALRALCLLAAVLCATALHAHEGEDHPPRLTGAITWAGPGVSGAWYDAARDGEGFVVEFLPDGTALAVWFTYPATGEAGDQAWIIAQGGRAEGRTIRFAQVLKPRGGVFGDAFDASRIELPSWGTLEIEFADCAHATARYVGPAGYGSGTRSLTRLTSLNELDCANGTRALTASGGRALEGLRNRSGAWYVATRSGEGWLIEDLPNGQSVVYWFTYDPGGNQAWTIGVGTRSGARISIDANIITRGTHFGSAFDAAAIERLPWGTLTFDFSDCASVGVSYASTRAGYGSATRVAQRLTSLAGAPCIDGTPVARTAGTWTEGARMPTDFQSEHDVVAYEGRVYAIGGFGEPRGFKRYDPASDSWLRLPDAPAGRDHLSAFAIDGGVYFAGGSIGGVGDQTRAGFRYDVAANRWDPIAELPWVFGSHAVTLDGHVFLGDQDGSLYEYDARLRVVRAIERPSNTQRDHSQVVAFLGEIWVIAGRFPETASVSIYDPVAERWRAGPPIIRRRGGFAAAVDGDQIVIGGGEFISAAPGRVEPTLEVYAAGDSAWRTGPLLAVPVHGVAGAVVDGRFHVVSGSTVAGSTQGATGRVFSIRLEAPTP